MINDIIIIKKWNNVRVEEKTQELINWIKYNYPDKKIYLESEYNKNVNIDLIICLGGDGTLLHTNKILCQKKNIPIILFGLGTVGFIYNHNYNDYNKYLKKIFENEDSKTHINYLMRINIKYNHSEYNCINECLIHRGKSSHVIKLKLIIDNKPITELVADGLILSTSIGSTAYNLSAGGALVSPDTDTIILTPICPFSLSFRPLVLSSKSIIKLILVSDNGAQIDADGNKIKTIKKYEQIIISKSHQNIKLINIDDKNMDTWYDSIVQKLKWAN